MPFLEAMQSGDYRYAMLLWPRRHGKDKTCLAFLAGEMVRTVGNYGYVFPTSTLARSALWDNIDSKGFRVMDHIPSKLLRRRVENRMHIELVNGSTLTLFGSDRQISVGTNYRGLVLSEFALQDPHTYYYLRPILAENKGWIVLNSTTRGKNHLYDLYNLAKADIQWFTQRLTWRDTDVFSEADIQRERDAGMSDELIRSEYECDFSGLEGSYYIRYIDAMRLEGRIGRVPYDPMARVYTVWDLGMRDYTVILWYQLIGQEIHIIDAYTNHNQGLDHYAKIIADKSYIYDTHFAPHDIAVKELGTGVSRLEIAEQLGVKFDILPTLKTSVQDGIEVARGIFPRVWIDGEKCKGLITALENYSHDYDKRLSAYVGAPRHDQWSHYADAYRYLAIAVKTHSPSGSGMSVSDLYAKNAYNRRF